jgi:hypothetical protein
MAPDHDQLPLAVQDVAFVLDQVMVELPPEEIVEELNAMTAVGIGVAASTLRTAAPSTPMASSSDHRNNARIPVVILILPTTAMIARSTLTILYRELRTHSISSYI